MPQAYLRVSRRLQLTMFGDLFSGSPAHLRWMIAGVLKLARNANRIGAIFNSFISNMDRIVLVERQFSLALLLVMRYISEIYKKKEEVGEMRTRRKYWVPMRGCGQCFKGKQITASIILCSQSCDILACETSFRYFESQELWEKLSFYVIHSVADLSKRCSNKLFSSPTIASLPAKLNSAQLSSTSQASRRSMSGIDYVSAINVYKCRSVVPGRAVSQVGWRHMRTRLYCIIRT